MKRLLDLVLCAFGIAVLSPLCLLLSLMVWFGDRGPALYRGRRAGRSGDVFELLKFRTMVVNAERLGGPTTSDYDPRITKVGAFMRRYKLDELPQLLNVLKGDMSLVGPRPEVLSEVERYTDEQRRVLSLRAGITDLASLWNADEGAVLAGTVYPHAAYQQFIHPTKLALQLRYLDERSLWLDLKIIIYTVWKIFRKGWVPPELRAVPPPQVPAHLKNREQSVPIQT